MYPSPPDWNSPAPQSGWYLDRSLRSSSTPTRCSWTGWSALASLQQALQGRLDPNNGVGPLPDWNGEIVSSVPDNEYGGGVAVGWNRDVLRALYAVASTYQGVTADALHAIQVDAESGTPTVSAATLQVGLWIGSGADVRQTSFADASDPRAYRYGQGSPNDIQIPEGTSAPRTDVPPPRAVSDVVCNAISVADANLIPVVRMVSPFRFNVLAAFGILAVAVGAVVVLSRDVPVHKAKKNPTDYRRLQTYLNSPRRLWEHYKNMQPAARTKAVSSMFKEDMVRMLEWHDPHGSYRSLSKPQARKLLLSRLA